MRGSSNRRYAPTATYLNKNETDGSYRIFDGGDNEPINGRHVKKTVFNGRNYNGVGDIRNLSRNVEPMFDNHFIKRAKQESLQKNISSGFFVEKRQRKEAEFFKKGITTQIDCLPAPIKRYSENLARQNYTEKNTSQKLKDYHVWKGEINLPGNQYRQQKESYSKVRRMHGRTMHATTAELEYKGIAKITNESKRRSSSRYEANSKQNIFPSEVEPQNMKRASTRAYSSNRSPLHLNSCKEEQGFLVDKGKKKNPVAKEIYKSHFKIL